MGLNNDLVADGTSASALISARAVDTFTQGSEFLETNSSRLKWSKSEIKYWECKVPDFDAIQSSNLMEGKNLPSNIDSMKPTKVAIEEPKGETEGNLTKIYAQL